MADPISIASTALGFLGLFGNPNDAKRFEETKQLEAQAMAGSDFAYWKLRCLSGDTSAATRTNAMRVGFVTSSDGPCGYATDAAKANAKLAIGRIDASRLAAQGAATVAAGATQVGMNTNPGVFLSTTGGAVAGVTPPWVWIAVAAGAFFLLRGRK